MRLFQKTHEEPLCKRLWVINVGHGVLRVSVDFWVHGRVLFEGSESTAFSWLILFPDECGLGLGDKGEMPASRAMTLGRY